jgi:proline dehydrogenase
MPSVLRPLLISASRSERAEHLVRSSPLTQPLVARFVAGETFADARAAAERLAKRGLLVTYDHLGESVTDEGAVRRLVAEYQGYFAAAPRGSHFSLKLSQLGLSIRETLAQEALETLCAEAGQYDHRLRVDMEESATIDATLRAVEKTHPRGGDPGIVVQAMLHRAPDILQWAIDRDIRVRLVKGAYKEPPSVAYQGREAIRRAYLALLGPLLAKSRAPAVATHDDVLIGGAAQIAGQFDRPYEVQFLYGVREDLAREISQRGTPVRVYTPFGDAWYPYFMRRLAERPQNVGFFLRQVVDRSRNGNTGE